MRFRGEWGLELRQSCNEKDAQWAQQGREGGREGGGGQGDREGRKRRTGMEEGRVQGKGVEAVGVQGGGALEWAFGSGADKSRKEELKFRKKDAWKEIWCK